MKNKKDFFRVLPSVLFFLVVSWVLHVTTICAEETAVKKEVKKETSQQKESNNPYTSAKITTKIIPSINKTFGYDILVNGKTLVHQPNIPAMPGNDGFTTREKAQKVADFVVKKIRKNEMPPTVTIEDLKKMDALK